MLSECAPLSPHLHAFTNPEALQTLTFWDFMVASLHRLDWLNHWPLVIELNLQPLSPFQRSGEVG